MILVELISSYHFVFHSLSDLDPACSLSGHYPDIIIRITFKRINRRHAYLPQVVSQYKYP